MRAQELYQLRRKNWEHLLTLTQQGERSMQSLTAAQIQELGMLYREATSDLAIARRDFPRHTLTTELNQMVGRAHALIYRDEPLQVKKLWFFMWHGFPRVFRETARFTVIAALFLLIPALLAGVTVFFAPQNATWLLPAETQSLIPTIEQQELWVNFPIEERPYASSFIMRNNLQVAILAFGSGLSGGLYTLWILLLNGLILGGLLGLTAHHGVGFELATFVVGHGVIELSVIFMAGGSGLMMGWALLRPGLMRRRDALMLAARRAMLLLLGAMPFLVIAGIIEGFISPAENLHWGIKWGVGVLSGVIFYGYLLLGGRNHNAASFTASFGLSAPNND